MSGCGPTDGPGDGPGVDSENDPDEGPAEGPSIGPPVGLAGIRTEGSLHRQSVQNVLSITSPQQSPPS